MGPRPREQVAALMELESCLTREELIRKLKYERTRNAVVEHQLKAETTASLIVVRSILVAFQHEDAEMVRRGLEAASALVDALGAVPMSPGKTMNELLETLPSYEITEDGSLMPEGETYE